MSSSPSPPSPPATKEEVMDRISTESIKKNWARVGSRRSVNEYRTLKDVIDPALYVDYMDLKMKQKLGEGAFAKVFQATYLFDGREVAVKMLRDEHLLHLSEVFMFLKEFKTIKHLRHPNIVQIVGIGGIQGRVIELFIVQDLCKGGTLREVVQDQMITVGRQMYSLRTAVSWALDVAKALRYLHRCKPPVVHRDLKLENVILSTPFKKSGVVWRGDEPADSHPPAKLADFGLATFVDHGMKNKRLFKNMKTSKEGNPLGENSSKVVRMLERMRTLSSFGGSDETGDKSEHARSASDDDDGNDVTGVAGSFGYMAPEVFKDQHYNEKVDVFSFGVMLYNLCYRVIPALQINPKTGETEDMNVYVQRVSMGWRQQLNDARVPALINDIIGACWSQDPKDRPSMSDVVTRLEAVLADPTVDLENKKTGSFCCCF